MKSYYVYILTNKNYSVLYIGVTNDLVRRIYEHKTKSVEGFTARYQANKLVYYDICDDPGAAISREKQLKSWKRAWKEDLITNFNPGWNDLCDKITDIE